MLKARFLSHAKFATFAKFLGGVDIESIGKDILDCAYAIHTRFGSGLLEKAYRVILATERDKYIEELNEDRRVDGLCPGAWRMGAA